MSGDASGGGRTVLVVEDHHEIAELVRLHLARDGYRMRVEHRGDTGLAAARSLRPAACVLDIALPGMDGVEICRRLRQAGDWTPVIFLTARDDEVDRVLGLELGADDYVTKPFSPRELVARVRAVLRRSADAPDEPPVRRVGPVVLDPARRRVTVAGRPVSLTGTEFALLEYLMSRPGRVLSRERLLSAVWGWSGHPTTRTVDVHVAQLRAKLGEAKWIIRTERGVGYACDG